MAQVILFDGEVRDQLLPLTHTRPVCDLRIGLLTIREKWSHYLGYPVSVVTQDYLAESYPLEYEVENYVINGAVLPSDALVALIRQMDINEAFLHEEQLVVAKLDQKQLRKLIDDEAIEELDAQDLQDTPFLKISSLTDLILLNEAAIIDDFRLLSRERKSMPLPPGNTLIGPSDKLFIEVGAKIQGSYLNTSTGPIYLSRDAVILEGCFIRGPFALGEHSLLRMGSKIYGPVATGPFCKIGGEIESSLFQGYSNKSYDGYLGHCIIGNWCNLGAGTLAASVQHTYDEIEMWSERDEAFIFTGTHSMGAVLGDHTKTANGTVFSPGSVTGICANTLTPGIAPRFIPSFAASANGQVALSFSPEDAFRAAEQMMTRRQTELTIQQRLLLLKIFEITSGQRPWEK
jgi:UDP-N-acetylglucosamine diphosphorylase/glucosamine-1-phosphate N-acetyltransferase